MYRNSEFVSCHALGVNRWDCWQNEIFAVSDIVLRCFGDWALMEKNIQGNSLYSVVIVFLFTRPLGSANTLRSWYILRRTKDPRGYDLSVYTIIGLLWLVIFTQKGCLLAQQLIKRRFRLLNYFRLTVISKLLIVKWEFDVTLFESWNKLWTIFWLGLLLNKSRSQ